MKKTVSYSVFVLALIAFAWGAASYAQTFFDSNIIPITTPNAPPAPQPCLDKYDLYCYGGDKQVQLTWFGNFTGDHTIELSRTAPESKIVATPSAQLANGCYTSTVGSAIDSDNLKANTNYSYQLKVTMKPSGPVQTFTASCKTLGANPDAPSKLNVWTLSQSTLFLNWKDNLADKPHTFTVERIKLTPEKPTFDFNLAKGREGIKTIDANSIQLFWNNTTNKSTTGPFFHRLERINRKVTNASNASTNPFDQYDTNGNGKVDETEKNSSVFTYADVDRSFLDDVSPGLHSTKTEYDATDGGLLEGTEYYYRVKACSFIMVDLSKQIGINYAHAPVTVTCSRVQDNRPFYATTTLPATPTNASGGTGDLTFTNVGKTSMDIQWIDQSEHEDGYDVSISTCLTPPSTTLPDKCISGVGHYYLGAVTGKGGLSNVMSKHFNGLDYGTSYTITARAYKDSLLGNGRIYSQPLSGSRVTTPVLETAVSDDSAGTIAPDCPATHPAACFYTYNYSDNSGFQTATVTTVPTDTDHFSFIRLTGCDAGYNGTGKSCTVTMNGARTVTAVYNRIAYDYTVTTNGACLTPTQTDPKVETKICQVNTQVSCPTAPSGCTVQGCTASTTFLCGSVDSIQIEKLVGSLGPNSFPVSLLGWWNGLNLKLTAQQAAIIGVFDKAKADIGKVADYVLSLLRKEASAADGTEVTYPLWSLSPMPSQADIRDVYFKQVKASLSSTDQYASTYKDEGLSPDTVYLYRVKAIYASGETAYSIEGAGKTLAGSSGTTYVNLCTRNSVCEHNIPASKYTDNTRIPQVYDPAVIDAQNEYQGFQCNNNADCRDVGTSRQFFEEKSQ